MRLLARPTAVGGGRSVFAPGAVVAGGAWGCSPSTVSRATDVSHGSGFGPGAQFWIHVRRAP